MKEIKNCNNCDNRNCKEHASVDDNGRIEFRRAPNSKLVCQGHKEYQKHTISFLELAMKNSTQEVVDLLSVARLQFVPANNRHGFELVKH